MSTQEEQALHVLAAAWVTEDADASEAIALVRRDRSLGDRVAQGLAMRGLSVVGTASAAGGRMALTLRAVPTVDPAGLQIRQGDPVRVWHQDPDEDGAQLGVLSRWSDEGPVVVLDRDWADELPEEGLRLDIDAPRTTFVRGRDAIRAFLTSKEHAPLRSICFGEGVPRFDRAATWTPLDAGLLDDQRAAVALALCARDVALIHGPPGTGKTRTVVEVVRQLVARGNRVLVAAASHAAVDNVLARLVPHLDAIRMGHPARVDANLEAYTLDARVEQSEQAALARSWFLEARAMRRRANEGAFRSAEGRAERRAAFAEARGLERDARDRMEQVRAGLLQDARVVCATAAGIAGGFASSLRFDVVVLDEADQLVDPLALVSVLRGTRLVLAGDHEQLGPTVTSPRAARLHDTIFGRLARRHPTACVMLTVQHRMHPVLMAFPSSQTYGGRLVASDAVLTRDLAALGVPEDPLRPGPLVWVDTAGRGWEEVRSADQPSIHNPGQADRTAAEVRRLVGRGVAAGDIALITPYRAQVQALRTRLADLLGQGLEIDSVDGFQGREREVVVLDLVRSGEDGIGFLADLRRINVAITRARAQLLIVGDSATVCAPPYFAALLNAVEAAGGYVSAWTDEAPPWGDG